MQLFVHALAGAALGAYAGRPSLAALGGLVSHAVLDELPHRDTKHVGVIALDVAVTLALLGVLGTDGGIAVLVGGVAGMLPDAEFLLMAAHWRTPRQSIVPHHRRGDALQPHSRLTNLVVQGAVAAVSLLLLLYALGRR